MTVARDPLMTERLILRALTAEDARGPYADWVRDKIVNRYLELRLAPPNANGLAAFVAKMNASSDNYLFGLFRRDDMAHIGNVRLGPVERDHRRGTVGILIGARESWGKGYATEAIQAICAFAFRELGIEKLSAGLYAPNEGSQRAFEKAGFYVDARRKAHAVFEGRRVDVVEMARFRDGLI